MGNCQDQFQNASQYDTQNDKSQVLIDRSHKRIFATKYEKNVGFIINQQDKQFDNQIMHKSIAISRKSYIQKAPSRKKPIEIQPPKLQLLNLKFYHSLGLPQYTYPSKPQQMLQRQWGDVGFIHESQDRTGVIYIGQRNSKGLFHGNGILKANTVHYIGQFCEGTKHNHGRQIYTNEVYEGEFQFDFRKGKGVRYTDEYVDEGEFDMLIKFGVRSFKNGNQYKGTFKDNKMHTIEEQRNREKFWFYDASNHLMYEDELVIEEGQLIKAKKVKNSKTAKHIGCFIGKQIVRVEDERYERLMRNWDQPDVERWCEFQSDEKHMTESDIIRKRIEEWQ